MDYFFARFGVDRHDHKGNPREAPAAYEEGEEARANGFPISFNPYGFATEEYALWWEGYRDESGRGY